MRGAPLLLAALVLPSCSPSAQPDPPPGVVARFTDEIDRKTSEDKAVASAAADARAQARAEKAVQRIAGSEARRRPGGDRARGK